MATTQKNYTVHYEGVDGSDNQKKFKSIQAAKKFIAQTREMGLGACFKSNLRVK